MKVQEITCSGVMLRLEAEEEDWLALPSADAKRMLFLLMAARRFEEAILSLDKGGLVHGPAHSSIGQEGGAAGCISALPPRTKINGTHRAHHQILGKALHTLYPADFDPSAAPSVPGALQRATDGLLAEILGLRTGWNGGRGGSMHLRNDEVGVVGTNAIVAGGLPIACGFAWMEKVSRDGGVVVTFFGDGAIHQGTAHEAFNLAALYDLPVIFFLENNRYAVSMSVEQSTREANLLTRPMAHGIPAIQVDGMDPLAVRLATQWALREIRERRGPAFIQADVYRYYHQSVPYPGSAFGYRAKEEEDAWWARDPLPFLQRRLVEAGKLTDDGIGRMDSLASGMVTAAVDACVEGKGSGRKIRAHLWPEPATVDDGITGDLSELRNLRFAEPEDFAPGEMQEMKLIEVMPLVVGTRMEADPRIYVLGEDVANMGGGTVGATKGLPARFPDRIVNTPICENGFCGMAAGMASAGLRPVIEMMYSDFFLVAADQLLNQIAKLRHLYGGGYPMPVVLRCRVPGTEGYGSQHSMDPAGAFALYPGWRIVAPSTSFDYVGLMNSALRCEDPVLVIECQALHRKADPVPPSLDYYIPIGKARRVARGRQMTLLCFGAMVDLCVEVARDMDVSADIIDLRTLSLRDLDYETIGESVRRTNNIAIVEQSTRGTSIGGHIADEIQRRFFDALDQPVKRVVGRWAPPTVSRVLEAAAVAGRSDVEQGIVELLQDSGQSAGLAA